MRLLNFHIFSVECIRAQRAFSIQMPDQYVFCHLAFLEYVLNMGYVEEIDLTGFDEEEIQEWIREFYQEHIKWSIVIRIILDFVSFITLYPSFWWEWKCDILHFYYWNCRFIKHKFNMIASINVTENLFQLQLIPNKRFFKSQMMHEVRN